ncbi:hypothetical protein PYCC9005_000155 [Savitreella phatthalungensis]
MDALLDGGIDDALHTDAYAAAVSAGERAGAADGMVRGRVYGIEVGYERLFSIGVLRGTLDVLRSLHSTTPKLDRELDKLDNAIHNIPRTNHPLPEHKDFDHARAIADARVRALVQGLPIDERKRWVGLATTVGMPEFTNGLRAADRRNGHASAASAGNVDLEDTLGPPT